MELELFKASFIEQFKDPESPIHWLMLEKHKNLVKFHTDIYASSALYSYNRFEGCFVRIERLDEDGRTVNQQSRMDYELNHKQIDFFVLTEDEMVERELDEDHFNSSIERCLDYYYIREIIAFGHDTIELSVIVSTLSIENNRFVAKSLGTSPVLSLDLKSKNFNRPDIHEMISSWKDLRNGNDSIHISPCVYVEFQPTKGQYARMHRQITQSSYLSIEEKKKLTDALMPQGFHEEDTAIVRMAETLFEIQQHNRQQRIARKGKQK